MGETYIEEMIARKASIVPTVLKVVLGAVCAGSIILGILGAGLFYSVALLAYENRSLDTKDYTSGYSQNADKRYVLIYDGQKKIILEPSDKMIETIYTVSPRKVFIKK